MMRTEEEMRQRRIREMRKRQAKAILANGGYIDTERRVRRDCKLSSVMAMLLGFLVALEIMVAVVMFLNIDLRSADVVGLFLAFLVVYFGAVTALTDR